MIVWDNRCVMHRATGYDDARRKAVSSGAAPCSVRFPARSGKGPA